MTEKIKRNVKKWEIDAGFLWQFSMDDFKGKYAGSFMGMAWAFLQPVMTILIYWFVFQVGFGNDSVKGYPFILWLISGLVPWFFISEGLVNVTTSLVEYSYLVKKILFNINILPLVKVISCFLVQIFLTLITIVFFCLCGYRPDLYYLQLFYYMAYMLVLITGAGYGVAALYVFFKDLIQIINIILQVIFWMTPIVWNFEIMPETVQKVLIYNPIYYIVQGYRDVFIDKEFFFQKPLMALYYWIAALLFLLLGKTVFRKLKVHFADVL